tara:strand:- start:3536 stop:3856 length:321 start_codon:yes stop_codon:yes gene_type:complete
MMQVRIFYCCKHDDFILDSYNNSFTLEDVMIYDNNKFNCDDDLDCNYEYLTLAKKENEIWKILDIKNNNEKWISENDNNSNLELYLDKICNGGISHKTLFNSLKDF